MDLEQEYQELMELAREMRIPEWKNQQAIVLKTNNSAIYRQLIPDFLHREDADCLENQLLEQLIHDTESTVRFCLTTMNGKHPEIPSRHLMDRLVEIDPENLQTITFLVGGEDTIHAKAFSRLLPSKK